MNSVYEGRSGSIDVFIDIDFLIFSYCIEQSLKHIVEEPDIYV